MESDISTAQEMEVDPNSLLSSFDSNETSNLNSKRIRYSLENKAKVHYFHKQGNSINKPNVPNQTLQHRQAFNKQMDKVRIENFINKT